MLSASKIFSNRAFSRSLAILRPGRESVAKAAAVSTSGLPATTRAAFVEKHGDRFQVKDLPIPVPGKGQVLVKIHASGVCHTDVHAVDGDWPVRINSETNILILKS